MSLDRTIAALAAHDLFANLPAEAQRLIAFTADRVELAPGARLFTQGTPADGAFVLMSGELDLEVTRDGGTASLGRVPAGALLGEMALLCQTVRPATAIAAGPVEAVRIARATFRRLLEEYPAGAAQMRSHLAKRLLTVTGALARVGERLAEGLPQAAAEPQPAKETTTGT